TVTFDRDIARAQGALAAQYATGGGDYPEAMDQALIRAVAQEWRPDAVKSMLLVADAPPHGELFGRTWAAAEAARAKRIHITPVAASGVADEAEYAMRAMAAATQSRYLFLTDDSGVGNPHAPPAIDCYLVTKLDALVRRVIDSQISGRRIEPEDQEIIRSVGKYDAGKCILPADFRWQNG
ncbi:MAG TPA: VWA domain-containing protein, partial [Sphingopyxis sp.]|nr:VWA domain-containing protein [Sphingopyxis sp.]